MSARGRDGIDVDLDWAERDLRALDKLTGEVAVGSLFEDERPPRGLAGLADWRSYGRLSSECLGGFLSGRAGETFLTPGRPRLAFDKVVIMGLGPRAAFDDAAFVAAVERVLATLAGLRVRRAVIDLPGRHANAVTAERALEVLDRVLRTGKPGALDAVTLLDDRDTQRLIEALRVRPGRRAPSAPR